MDDAMKCPKCGDFAHNEGAAHVEAGVTWTWCCEDDGCAHHWAVPVPADHPFARGRQIAQPGKWPGVPLDEVLVAPSDHDPHDYAYCPLDKAEWAMAPGILLVLHPHVAGLGWAGDVGRAYTEEHHVDTWIWRTPDQWLVVLAIDPGDVSTDNGGKLWRVFWDGAEVRETLVAAS